MTGNITEWLDNVGILTMIHGFQNAQDVKHENHVMMDLTHSDSTNAAIQQPKPEYHTNEDKFMSHSRMLTQSLLHASQLRLTDKN